MTWKPLNQSLLGIELELLCESVFTFSPVKDAWRGETQTCDTHTHTHKNAQRDKDKNNKPPWVLAARLFETHHALKCSSYPVLLVLLLVFCVGVHVGAHTGVAGRAGDAADAVRGVLPPDAQVRLLTLLLLLLTAVTAGWGETVRGRKCVYHPFVWNMSFIKRQPISVVCFGLLIKKTKTLWDPFCVMCPMIALPHRAVGIFCGKTLITTSSLLFKYPWALRSICSVCLFAVCLHLSCPL